MKELKINLSDEWFTWVEDEAIHRGQSESELLEDALAAFLAKLQADVERIRQDAFHRKTFAAALEGVFHAHARVTRRKWANRAIYCCLEQGQLCIRGFNREGDTLPHPWTITEEDYFADDWEVVDG